MNTSSGSEKIVFCRDAIAPARAAAAAFGFGLAARLNVARVRDHDLLRRPDHQPHVVEHR